MMSINARRLESEFSKWLEEEIYVSTGIQHYPRKRVILMFIHDLMEMIKQEGYKFRCEEKEMAMSWARYLFRLQRGLMSSCKLADNPDARPEDYYMYVYIFDEPRCRSFTNTWKDGDDFYNDRNGHVALQTAFYLAWYYVDINTSSKTSKVDEMLATSDSEGDERPKIRRRRGQLSDAYLDDQANAASKYNRWD
jgi:hypothetical protein